MARRYSRKPKLKSVGAAGRNDGPTPSRAKESMIDNQTRATNSQTAAERNDDASAETATRAAPTRSTGDPPVTYQADRHRKPYDTDNGTATIAAWLQLNTP